MSGALEDVTVVDLTGDEAGALATMFLADHGAQVLRAIMPETIILRDGGYRVWDRGKTCVRCGAYDDGPDADLATLIQRADVVIEDYRPGARPAWLAIERLAKLHPRLIRCSITAYGEHGPYRNEPAIDDLVLARAGVLAGLPGFRPAPVHTVHPLPSAGAALLAVLGIASALFARLETGRGQPVATSLLQGALIYHPKVLADRLKPNVFQTNPSGSTPFYSVYECADGSWVQLGCVHAGFVAKAAGLMGLSAIITQPGYGRGHLPETPEADADLRARLRDVMRTRHAADWEAEFEANDIPHARSRFTEESMEDPQVLHNGMVVTRADPAVGKLDQMGVPIRLSTTPGTAGRARGPYAVPAADVIPTLSKQPGGEDVGESGSDGPRLPLAGVRVLEITNLIAGPIAGRLLADLGADVMKLEPPTGDLSRPIGRTYFYSLNFAKRSVAIDTSRPEGRATVTRLAASCDIVLANLRPGATARMGIDREAMPQLIEAQISGYGSTGPYAHRPGIDPLAQALMGLERAQGGEGNPPSFPAQLAPTDFTTGMMAAIGSVLALYARRRDRASGQRIETNLLDGGIVLSSAWFTRYASRDARPLADGGQYGLNPFHRLYELSDGFIYVAADTAAQRQAFATTLGADIDGLTAPGATHPNDTSGARALAASVGRMTLADAVQLLSAHDIPFAPAQLPDAAAFFYDPHCAANDLATTARHPNAGDLTVVHRYIQFGEARRTTTLPTPLLGEQTAAVLREAGFTGEDIAALYDTGIVMTEEPAEEPVSAT